MNRWIRAVKQNPFYREWHFEIGILVLFIGLTLLAITIYQQARLGAESHRWACVYQADLQQRIDQGEAYLRMTPAERIRRYGQALGSTPATYVRATLANEKQILETTRGLHC